MRVSVCGVGVCGACVVVCNVCHLGVFGGMCLSACVVCLFVSICICLWVSFGSVVCGVWCVYSKG